MQYDHAYMAILPKDLTRGPAVTPALLSVWIQTVARKPQPYHKCVAFEAKSLVRRRSVVNTPP